MYCSSVFLAFLFILKNFRNIQPFSGSYEKNKVLFSYSSRYLKFISASQKKLRTFLYCFCVFIYFSAIVVIYLIFGYVRTVTNWSKVFLSYSSWYSKVIASSQIFCKALFYYSWRYSKFIGESQNPFEAFFIIYVCFFNFRLFWGCLYNILSFTDSYEKN